MKYTNLGQTDIKISRICIGGMSFGKVFPDFHQWVIGEKETEAVVARAIERGVNFIDTANCYAHGTSEEFIGKALRGLGVARDKIVLATKVFFNDGCLGKEAIARECEASLKRLGTDYIDLYIIHRFDYTHPIEETMEALDSLVKSGKVRALGASAMYAYQLYDMQLAAEKNGWTKFSSMQCHYNLLYREDEREMLPVCAKHGMSITPYSPLASGHLTRPEWDSASVRSTTDKVMHGKYDAAKELDMPIVSAVAEVAEARGVPMGDVALAWLLAKGTTPIVGCSKPERVDDAVRAVELELAPEEITSLEAPYRAHDLTGVNPRPGEKELAGTVLKR